MTLVDTGDGATQETTEETTQTAETQNTQTTETAPPEWFLMEGVPGTGEAPEFYKKDKYGSLAEQAKAYQELEKRFGSFTGSPKDGEYSVSLSDELVDMGVSIEPDDPLYADAVEFAKESNMSQDGFNKLMNLYAMSKVAEGKALDEFKANELKSLGDNAKARIDNLVNWGKANLSDDLFDGFQEMAISANAVKAMEKLVSMTRSAPIDSGTQKPSTSVSSEEVLKMQFEKDEFGNRRLSTDPEFRKRYNKLKEEVWGSEEHRTIMGA